MMVPMCHVAGCFKDNANGFALCDIHLKGWFSWCGSRSYDVWLRDAGLASPCVWGSWT
jgi:hypothetical protein